MESLYKYCRDQKVLHSNQETKLINQLGPILQETPNIYKKTVNQPGQKVFIVGDLHGSIIDFEILFTKLVLIADFVKSNNMLIVLGDYVDRGLYGHQIFTFLAALKVLFPDRVQLMRGNHETSQMNNFFGYQSQVENYYGSQSKMFPLMSQTFSYLPLCLFINNETKHENYMLFHGGVPVVSDFKSIDDIIEHMPEKALEPQDPISQQFLWSDPNSTGDSLQPSHRGVGYLYGKTKLLEFIDKMNIAKVFRGHEMVMDAGGVRNDFGIDRHYTVFSSSNYMGQGNTGGIAVLDVETGSLSIKKMSFIQ